MSNMPTTLDKQIIMFNATTLVMDLLCSEINDHNKNHEYSGDDEKLEQLEYTHDWLEIKYNQLTEMIRPRPST